MTKPPCFTPYFLVEKNGTTQVYEQPQELVIMLEAHDIEHIGGIHRKQLDLYLFRHPEYRTIKYKKKKLISLDILGYVFKNAGRKSQKGKVGH